MDSFEVENFRSLKHLKLEKLARVNLLVGKNNSGKTSVLEALLTLTSIERPYWPIILDSDRNLDNTESDIQYMFYGFDSQLPISLIATYGEDVKDKNTRFNVLIASSNAQKAESETLGRSRRASSSRRNDIDSFMVSMAFASDKHPVQFELSRNESEEEYKMNFYSKSSARYLNDGWSFPAAERNHSTLLSTEVNLKLLGYDLEGLIVQKRTGPLLELLQQVDARIKAVSIGGNRNVYLDLGEDFRRLMPLELMGEGLQRLLLVTAAIASIEGGVLFIDEIDNGLHYSVLRVLWVGILKIARDYDVQIFVTTHSAEALRHLTWVLDDENHIKYRNDVAAYTLVRANDDTLRSYRHDYEQLEYAIEHGIEVRN